jgi:hypothetical protein
MGLRKSFLKPFEKVKQTLTGGRRKVDERSGGENDQEGGKAQVGGGEASQRNSHLHSEVEDVMEMRPSRGGNDVDREKVGQVDSPSSIPSISHGREPDSM